VSKVFQGLTKAAGSLEATHAGIKLWVHEVLRVFFDRLVDDADRLWLGRLLSELTEKHFNEKLTGLLGLTKTKGAAAAGPGGSSSGSSRSAGLDEEELLTGLRGLMFGDFMVPDADVKVYREITDQGKMLHVVRDYLADMNAGSKKPQQLVLFQFALEHVARISSVISQPGGCWIGCWVLVLDSVRLTALCAPDCAVGLSLSTGPVVKLAQVYLRSFADPSCGRLLVLCVRQVATACLWAWAAVGARASRAWLLTCRAWRSSRWVWSHTLDSCTSHLAVRHQEVTAGSRRARVGCATSQSLWEHVIAAGGDQQDLRHTGVAR
jgi:hypothetical protein